MKKPTTQSHKLGDDNLMQYVKHIITEMKGDEALFPNPVPALSIVGKALTCISLSFEKRNRNNVVYTAMFKVHLYARGLG